MAQLLQAFPDDLRVIYRHYPLISIHDKAALAVQASEAAGLQDKFWEMHDLLLGGLNEWNSKSIQEFQDWLVLQASQLGLDREKFVDDMNSESIQKLAQDAWESNSSMGLPGTPVFLVNGEPFNVSLSYSNMEAFIKKTLLEQDQYKVCPEMVVDSNKSYTATINTEKGDIKIELLPDVAPVAVNNFIFLAQQGWYDDVTFHRVIPDFMAQTGDPSGTGMGGPGYEFDNEILSDLKFDAPGMVGMANSGANTNGSQFFITYAPAPHLDGGYTIFGRVITGMDILKNLTPRDPSQSEDLPAGDRIIGITIEEN